MENERTLTPFTEWINHSGKFQLNIYDKKGNLINNIEERERMKNKFNISDSVFYNGIVNGILDIHDGDIPHYTIQDGSGYRVTVGETSLTPHIEIESKGHNKFKLGDKVIVNAIFAEDRSPICEITKILDSQNYLVKDSRGCEWVMKENIMKFISDIMLKKIPNIEEGTKQEKEYNELLEENEELKELLDIAKATIQMISELI